MPSQQRSSTTPSPSRNERGPYSTGARAKACGNCRRRKVKCDGAKPVCSQCLRLSPHEISEHGNCEYSDTKIKRTGEQVLKDTIKALEARIRELEVTSDASVVRLHTPYQIQQSNTEVPLEDVNLPNSQLLEAFFRHATDLGFFLHVSRFRNAVMLPIDSPGRPCQGLISVVLLLGHSLSNGNPPEPESYSFHNNTSDDGLLMSASLTSQEEVRLAQAQIDVAGILSSSHPDRIVHAIQAEVLLATYLLRQGRILEGKYHLSAATSLAFSAKLHRIRSLNRVRDTLTSAALPWVVDPTSSSSNQSIYLNVDSETLLPPPADSISEGERINAFWTVLAMGSCWAVAADSSPNFTLERYIEEIDTPWPMNIDEYMHHLNPEYGDSVIIVRFLQGQLRTAPTPSETGPSALTLYAQASILLSRAAAVALTYHPTMSSAVLPTFLKTFNELDESIDRFKSNLRSLLTPNADGHLMESMVFTAHMISHLATIVLHSKIATVAPSSDSLPIQTNVSAQKRLEAAMAIANIARQQWSFTHAATDPTIPHTGGPGESGPVSSAGPNPNPFLGSLWLAVGQVLIEEISLERMRSDRGTGEREAGLLDDLRCIFESAQLSRVYHSPLADYLFHRLQKFYQSRL
ncbi:Zn(2)-Cys(6) binuclear cluster domain-containing protein [Lentinula raphanica]|uniref:Zn(2)-Cys(6) binuclear cluster domain-containing protein n=1 Tax=Lentinula raphanica TaxID=153919 RepID=A0AA38PGW5_9AGAR|nr:Zn(2)-Cys(6) binuclear cluster domain-containing protein [Lentinula raphanica]